MLRSNPHMHLFECAIAWTSVDPHGPWRELAGEIAALCRKRFVREDGALLEFFDADWRPVDNGAAAIEPGHQFEWTWLLCNWERVSGQRCDDIYRRFYEIGETRGICPQRKVAIDGLTTTLEPAGPQARLWPQTEWLKSSLALAENAQGGDRDRFLANARSAANALWRYLEGVQPGLWRDKMKADGSFIDEPAPASSFYHIVCAISELAAFKLN